MTRDSERGSRASLHRSGDRCHEQEQKSRATNLRVHPARVSGMMIIPPERGRVSLSMTSVRLAIVTAVVAAVCATGRTAPPDEAAKQFVAKHCLECHNGAKPKGDVRLDALTADLGDKANRELWLAAVEQLKAGTMPPEKKPRPDAKDAAAVAEWVNARLEAAELARREKQGRATARRLNRVEYENTVRDLLGIDVDLKELLPPDSAANGFDNIGDAHAHLVVPDGKLPRSGRHGPEPRDRQRPAAAGREEAVQPQGRAAGEDDDRERLPLARRRPRDVQFVDVARGHGRPVLPAGPRPLPLPHLGARRSRAPASRSRSASTPGRCCMGTKNHLVGYFDAPARQADGLRVRRVTSSRGTTIRILPYGLATAQTVTQDRRRQVRRARASRCSGSRSKGRCTTPGRPRATAASSATCRRSPSPVFNNSNRVEVASKNPEADAETHPPRLRPPRLPPHRDRRRRDAVPRRS